ncbi:uncharacterized protein METZ01_LOCUS93034 [marine metagenome]|uniref:Uncharacterized protein n=1 Tax=marine metagenome TaxID=408172 RepID=A0A381VIQ1_9ZZZZ
MQTNFESGYFFATFVLRNPVPEPKSAIIFGLMVTTLSFSASLVAISF